MKRKLLIVLSLFFVLFLSFMPSNVVFAEDESEREFEGKENFDQGEVNRSQYAGEGERFYYQLEAGMPDDDKAGFFNVLGKASDAISVGLNESIMLVNKVFFSLNVIFSGWLIGTLEMTQDFKFVDKAIDKVSVEVKDLVGVSGYNSPSFVSNGMFATLLKVIALFVVLYAFYQFIWKRSFIASFSELFKFIVVLVTALLLFTNYSSFLTGMNNMSTEIGNFVVGSQVKQDNHNSRVNTFSKRLWDHFVDRPYMTLQYGTADLNHLAIDDIDGQTRIRELLTSRTGSKERKEFVDKEINTRENYYMSYDSVTEKTYMNMVFFSLNGITSIPVYMIALAIIFTQFWFVIMALIAPFALLIASFPSQFKVLKRYFFELSLPLMIKIGLHFVLIIIMFLTSLVQDIQGDISSDLFGGQLGTAFINAIFYCMLFFAIFILRKRITNLLTSGSEMVGEIREGLGGVTTKPVKKAVQTTATVAGAAVGATVAGPTGAMMGANMGSTAGKMFTGESGGIANATQDVARTAYQYEALKHYKGKDKKKDNELKYTPEQKEAVDIKEMEHNEKLHQGYKDTNEFLEEKEVDNKDKFIKEMDNQGIDFSKISKNTLDRHYKENEKGNVNPHQMARDIREHQDNESSRVNNLRNNKKDQFHGFMEEQNLNQSEMNDVYKHLEDKAIDIAHIPKRDYVAVDKDIRNRLEGGELINYKDEFKKGLEQRANARRLEKQRDRITEGRHSSKQAMLNLSDSQNTKDYNLPTSTLDNQNTAPVEPVSNFYDQDVPPLESTFNFYDQDVPPLEPVSNFYDQDVPSLDPATTFYNQDVPPLEPTSNFYDQNTTPTDLSPTTDSHRIEETPIYNKPVDIKEELNQKESTTRVKVQPTDIERPKGTSIINESSSNPSYKERDRTNINDLNNTSYSEIGKDKLD